MRQEFNSALAVATGYTVAYPPGITGLNTQSTTGGVQHEMKITETEMSILVTLYLDRDTICEAELVTRTRLRRHIMIRVYKYPIMDIGSNEFANDQAR